MSPIDPRPFDNGVFDIIWVDVAQNIWRRVASKYQLIRSNV